MTRQKPSLRFRLTSPLRESLPSFESQPVTIEFDDPHHTLGRFFKELPEQATDAKRRSRFTAQAEGSFTVSNKLTSTLYTFERGELVPDFRAQRIIDGTVVAQEVQQALNDKGALRTDLSLPFSAMPDPVRDRFAQVEQYLSGVMSKVFGLIRWRLNVLGEHHRPFYSGSLSYSRDGTQWYRFHPDLHGGLEITWYPLMSARMGEEVKRLFISDRSEPLSRQLYREAVVQRANAPRSALVVAVAAIEAGLKECIVRVHPETRWLLEELQSPPLALLLEQYWTQLHRKPMYQGKEIVIPPEVIEEVKKGVTIRNKIVHGWDRPIDWVWLKEFVNTIGDLVWIFDYVGDVEWAIEYVRKEQLSNYLR